MIAWIKTYATLIKWASLALLVVGVLGGMFWWGYHTRDLSAHAEAADAKTHEAQAIADALAAKAAETQANQAAGAQAAEWLTARQDYTKDNFQIIYRDVVHYVQAKPVPAVCDLDADGLRIWNAANAGRADAAATNGQSHAAH